MTAGPCVAPIPTAELVAYERGELSAGDDDRVEAHVFGCADCTRRLDELYQLRAAVIDVARAGGVTTGATAALIDRAVADGVAIRSYRVAAGETVACTCSPSDDFVAVRLTAGLSAVDRVDMDVDTRILDTGEVRSHHRDELVIDAATGEVIVLYAGRAIREAPRSRWTMHLRARGPDGERVLGPFTLDHTPWDQAVPGARDR